MEIDNFVIYDGNISYEKFNNNGSFYRSCIEDEEHLLLSKRVEGCPEMDVDGFKDLQRKCQQFKITLH